MYKHLTAVFLLLTVVVTACTRDLPTESEIKEIFRLENRAENARQVPFKGRFDGTTQSVRVDDATLQVAFTGAGQATHLGHTHAEATLNLNSVTFEFTGATTLTGADGSQLYGTLSGQLVPREWPLFDVVGSYTITGGTRRFAGASGSGAVRGEVNWETDEASFQLEGTVSSVGSLRR